MITPLDAVIGGACIAIFFFLMGTMYSDACWALASINKYVMHHKGQPYRVLKKYRAEQLEATEAAFIGRKVSDRS